MGHIEHANDPLSVVFVFIMPIGLSNIGYRMYFVNASWDIVIAGLIVSQTIAPSPPRQLTVRQAYFWVETKGRTLEEIDAVFEGQKHSNVPDVAAVRTGKAAIDVTEVEHELEKDVVEMKIT